MKQQKITEFNTFFGDNYKMMVGVAKRKVDQASIAEEIVQEAFNIVWQRWDDLENPISYLRTTVSNRCKDELRKRQTQRNNMQYFKDEPFAETHYVTDLLSQISVRRRTAIFLKFYEDKTNKEIAKAMHIPTGTAKSLVHRGMADLKLVMA